MEIYEIPEMASDLDGCPSAKLEILREFAEFRNRFMISVNL